MLLREWILAALFAVAAAVFAVGAALVWGVGVGLMVGAVLLAVWSWSIVSDNDADAPAVDDVEADGPVSPTVKRSDATGAQTPAQMMAALVADDATADDELE